MVFNLELQKSLLLVMLEYCWIRVHFGVIGAFGAVHFFHKWRKPTGNIGEKHVFQNRNNITIFSFERTIIGLHRIWRSKSLTLPFKVAIKKTIPFSNKDTPFHQWEVTQAHRNHDEKNSQTQNT